jgi:hypothetical protein
MTDNPNPPPSGLNLWARVPGLDLRVPRYTLAVEELGHGQRRAYGPSVSEYRVTCTESNPYRHDGEVTPMSSSVAENRIRRLLAPNLPNKSERQDWLGTYVADVAETDDPGVWYVRIVTPYND